MKEKKRNNKVCDDDGTYDEVVMNEREAVCR